MTQEEKELLFQDLCTRLPYGVKVTFAGHSGRDDCILNSQHLNSTYAIEYLGLKPYLRPLSSMTEKEKDEFLHFFPFCRGDMYFDVKNTCVEVFECPNKITLYPFWDNVRLIDWLNKKMFDYRDLIPNGLALEAPEGMYNN